MDCNHRTLITAKVILVGDSGVGKSSILARLIDDTFISREMTTIGVEFHKKHTELPDNRLDCLNQRNLRKSPNAQPLTDYFRPYFGTLVAKRDLIPWSKRFTEDQTLLFMFMIQLMLIPF